MHWTRVIALAAVLVPPIGAVMPAPAAAQTAAEAKPRTFDLVGHRGARGLCPENTLPSFAAALDIGVTTLEMDAAITLDGVVVVSHDPTLNPSITRAPDGRWLGKDKIPIRSLTLTELQRYDVGRIRPWTEYAFRFAHQQPVDGTPIPALAQVMALVRKSGRADVTLSVEAKIDPHEPELTVGPEAFARTMVELLRKEDFARRTVIQSFDWRVLVDVQRMAPEIGTVYLSAAQPGWFDTLEIGQPGRSKWTADFDVNRFGGSAPRAIKAAGGRIWSPYYKDVDRAQLAEARTLGIDVVVWTVNDTADMQRMIDLGVDGIISDYPDRLRQVMLDRGMPVPPPGSPAGFTACRKP